VITAISSHRTRTSASLGHSNRYAPESPSVCAARPRARWLLIHHLVDGSARKRTQRRMHLEMPEVWQNWFCHGRTRDRRFFYCGSLPLQGVRRIVVRSEQGLSAGGVIMTIASETCIHCGSAHIQEARRTADEIIFRCLHCWKTFTSPIATRVFAPTHVGSTTDGHEGRVEGVWLRCIQAGGGTRGALVDPTTAHKWAQTQHR